VVEVATVAVVIAVEEAGVAVAVAAEAFLVAEAPVEAAVPAVLIDI